MVKLFDKDHKNLMEENSKKLEERLTSTVNSGPKSDGLFDRMSYSFSASLLHDLKNRKVTKK